MKKILLTGFGPFLHFKINPSQVLVEDLASSQDFAGGAEIFYKILPVAYHEWEEQLFPLILKLRPHFLLSFGVKAKTEKIVLEFAGRNLANSNKPDIYGMIKSNEVLEPQGPQYLSTPLPLFRLKRQLLAHGIPATISYSAGGYLCNCQFYKTLFFLKTSGLAIPMGFVHIPPFLPSSSGRESRNYENMKKGILRLLEILKK